jgi:hypothetical protein
MSMVALSLDTFQLSNEAQIDLFGARQLSDAAAFIPMTGNPTGYAFECL